MAFAVCPKRRRSQAAHCSIQASCHASASSCRRSLAPVAAPRHRRSADVHSRLRQPMVPASTPASPPRAGCCAERRLQGWCLLQRLCAHQHRGLFLCDDQRGLDRPVPARRHRGHALPRSHRRGLHCKRANCWSEGWACGGGPRAAPAHRQDGNHVDGDDAQPDHDGDGAAAQPLLPLPHLQRRVHHLQGRRYAHHRPPHGRQLVGAALTGRAGVWRAHSVRHRPRRPAADAHGAHQGGARPRRGG